MNTIYIFCNKLFHHFVVTMVRKYVGSTRLRAVTDRVRSAAAGRLLDNCDKAVYSRYGDILQPGESGCEAPLPSGRDAFPCSSSVINCPMDYSVIFA